ncbi:MAG TPA: DUF6493 family protein, partial [Rugosimonospora sp.]|nr:DUF6493 family protein [Rugosimonospora sp.]
MTAAALGALIDAADADGLVEFLAPLPEPARSALAPVAAQRYRDARAAEQEAVYDTRTPLDLEAGRVWAARGRVAALAWLGTGDPVDFPPRCEAGDPRWYDWNDFSHSFGSPALQQILVTRRPAWLPRFVAELVSDYQFDVGWRLAMAAGVPRPTGKEYLRSVARWAGHWPELGLREMVSRDPELLRRDLPAILDLADGVDLIVARDIAGYGKAIWLPVLKECLPAGHPTRDRILDLLLDRLSSDKDGRDASRYHQFLTKLGPTPGELAARRRALARVAGQRAPGSVTWAVRELAKLGRAGLVPPDELLAALEPALLATARSTAVTALAAVLRATDRDERLEARAMDLLVAAATHPHSDVQLAAVEAALPRLDRHPHVAGRLAELLPQLGPAAAERLRPALPAVAPVDVDQVDLPELLARAAAVPTAAATAIGLPAALDAVRRGMEPPAATVRLADCTTKAVCPVADLDELIDLLLRLTDGQWTSSALERALDGLATIGPRRPGDFARRIGPLLEHVHARLEQEVDEWGRNPTADIARLVTVWIGPGRGIA